jgi:hypothetical protein
MKAKVFRCPQGCPVERPCELKVFEPDKDFPVVPPMRCPYTLNMSDSEQWVLVDEYEVIE